MPTENSALTWTEFPELTRPALVRRRRGTTADFLKAWGPCAPARPGDKESLPLVSPAEWPEGGRAGSAQPVAMWGVVLDFDWSRSTRHEDGHRTTERHELYLDDAAFLGRLAASKIPCLDYLTYSAKPEWLKRRVVAALARPCEPARYPALVRLFARQLGFEREWLSGAIDESCQQPKRAYFAAHDERGLAGAGAAMPHSVPQLVPADAAKAAGSDLSGFVWDWSEEDLREVQLELSAADAAPDEDPRAAASVGPEVLASALGRVDPDDRDVWFRVGSALKTWGLRRGEPDVAFQLWADWSRRSPKWDEADAKKNWRSFVPERVSPGSIIHYARQSGWEMGEVDRINTEFFTVPVGGMIKVARIVPPKELEEWVPQDLPGIQLYSDKAFMARFNRWVPVKGRNKEGEAVEKQKPLGKFWLESPKHRHYPNGFRFDYSSTDHRDGYYNLFQGFAVEPDPLPHPETRCGAIRRHAREVICGDDQACYDYLMDWLAWKLQKPNLKVKTAIVARGLKGVGKDAFFNVIIAIIGPRSAFVVDDTKKFEKTFNSFMADRMLVVMDEANLMGHDVEEKLKHYITQDTITVERKGVDASMARNYCDFIIYGNRDAMVNVTSDERRYFCLEVAPHRRGDEAYFDALFEEIDGDGPPGACRGEGTRAFMAYLLQRDISGFRPSRFPKTESLHRQYLLTQQPGLLALRDWLCAPTFWDMDLYQRVKLNSGQKGPGSWLPADDPKMDEDGWPEGCAIRQRELVDYLVRLSRANGTLQRMNTPSKVRDALLSVFRQADAAKCIRIPLNRKDKNGRTETRGEQVFILSPLKEVRAAFERIAHVPGDWPKTPTAPLREDAV